MNETPVDETPQTATPKTESRWTTLIASSELQPGDIASATLTTASEEDLDLVAWRTADGTPCVMEARCPHMHSHLAVEGAVDGDEIICCTHWWRFNADGTGTYENANGEREERSPITVYVCRETDTEVQVQLPNGGSESSTTR